MVQRCLPLIEATCEHSRNKRHFAFTESNPHVMSVSDKNHYVNHSAPGKLGEGGSNDLKQSRNLRMEPCRGKPCPVAVGHRPEPSLAWNGGNPGCEA
jgi:hypothetical protein